MTQQKLATALFDALRFKRIRPIFQTRDEYGDIFVYEQLGKRLLTFDERFEQSSMLIATPALPAHRYIRAMLLVLTFSKPRHILHLGLGGGALIRAIASIDRGITHTAIELRASVKLIAEAYFLAAEHLPENTPLRLVCDNARQFVKAQKPAGYDLIFSDIYLANGMDVNQKSGRYIKDCAHALTDCGWLVLNFTQLPRFDDESFCELSKHFNEILIASVDAANYIVFAGKKRLDRPITAFAPSVRYLGEQLNIDLLRQFKHLMQLRDFFDHSN